jgi:hypothetical protein
VIWDIDLIEFHPTLELVPIKNRSTLAISHVWIIDVWIWYNPMLHVCMLLCCHQLQLPTQTVKLCFIESTSFIYLYYYCRCRCKNGSAFGLLDPLTTPRRRSARCSCNCNHTTKDLKRRLTILSETFLLRCCCCFCTAVISHHPWVVNLAIMTPLEASMRQQSR